MLTVDKERISLDPSLVRGTSYYNFSKRPLEQVINYFPKELLAEKIVVLPDLSPGRTPLPTGCSVELDINKNPEWRHWAVSDVGCGMQVLRSRIFWADFERDTKLWDEVADRLEENKGQLGDLGSGNHFIDAASDEGGLIYFVIHTGSRDESPKATELVDQPEKFDKVYQEVTDWARRNRDSIAQILKQQYGELELVLDKKHNFYQLEKDKAIIYKGAVKLLPDETSIIPSSMNGDMVIIENSGDTSEINYAVSHGTGRVKSRGQSKGDALTFDFASLRKQLYIPERISNASISSENPNCYRPIDEVLLSIADLVKVQKRLSPIAYIGQI